MRLLLSLLLPGGLLAIAALASARPELFPDALPTFLRVYPYGVFTVGVALALSFRRGRALAALVALAIADRALAGFPSAQTGGAAARYAFDAAGLLLPLDLAWLALVRERSAFSGAGLARLGVLAAQPALVAFLWLSYHPGLAAALRHAFLPGVAVSGVPLGQPALLAFALSFAAVLALWIRRHSPVERGIGWAITASFFALTTGREGGATTVFFATGGLLVVISLVESAFGMAYRDELTGLPSRRAFDEALAGLAGRYTIAMVDVDRFKPFNDSHGHDVGDQVLRMVAARLAQTAGGGRAFRYGGEEFALIFSGRSRDEALPYLEVVRMAVAEAEFTLRAEDRPKKKPKKSSPASRPRPKLSVTVSIGAAERGPRLATPEQVLKSADEALFRAKQAGRNRVSV